MIKLENSILVESHYNKKTARFLLVTANEFEKQSLLNYLTPDIDGVKKYVHSTGNIYYLCLFGKYPVVWVHLMQQGSNRSNASMKTVEEALTIFNIVATFSVGIAFGMNNTIQKIGDVLISKCVFPYELMRVTEINGKETYQLRDKPMDSNEELVNCLINWDWINNSNSNFYVGTFLCGEKLIDSNSMKIKMVDFLEKNNINDVIGGDMETVGIALSHKNVCNNSNWITIKGISDWGDGSKNSIYKDKYQMFASTNAVKFLYSFFNTTNLKNIFKSFNIKIKPNKCIEDIKINGIKLFYYRNYKNYTIYRLAKILREKNVRMSMNYLVEKLNSYEDVNIKDENIEYKTTNFFLLKKLEEILQCNGKLRDMNVSEEEKFLYKNREKHFYIPVTNVKAVVFDFDGTLTIKNDNRSCWQKIWNILGDPLNLCNEYYTMFKRKEITHKEWCELTLEYYKKKQLTKDQVLNLANNISLIKNIENVFRILKENNIKIYICSGSVYTIIEQVLGDLKKYVEEIRANNLVFVNNIIHDINGTSFDFEGKKDYVEKIASNLKIDIKDIAFVGNSDNDIYVGKSGARTILINPFQVDPGIQKNWTYYLGNIDNLETVLPYLIPNKVSF